MRLMAIVLLLAACGDEPLRVKLDKSLSADCVENILIAHEAWAGHLGFDAFEFCDTGMYEIMYAAGALSAKWKARTTSTSDLDGRINHARVVMRNGECEWQTAAHEIGHILTLDHRNEPNALMHKSYSATHTELTPGEIEQARLSL